MTISRMQQPRQLYGLGSLVKKITRPIKKIAKSPIGKAALLGAAAYGLGGAKFLGGKGLFTPGQGLSRFGNLKNFALDKLLGAQIERGEKGITREGGVFSFLKNYAVNNPGKAALFGLGAAGVAAPFFFGKDEEEEIIEKRVKKPKKKVKKKKKVVKYVTDSSDDDEDYTPSKAEQIQSQSDVYYDQQMARAYASLFPSSYLR